MFLNITFQLKMQDQKEKVDQRQQEYSNYRKNRQRSFVAPGIQSNRRNAHPVQGEGIDDNL